MGLVSGGAVVAGSGDRPFARDRFRGGALAPRRRSARSKAWGRPGALRGGGRESSAYPIRETSRLAAEAPCTIARSRVRWAGGLRHEDGEASVD